MPESDDWTYFRTLDDLAMLCGVHEEDLIGLTIKEAVDNSLDESGDCKIEITKTKIIISDNGKGIKGSDKDIAKLFSICRPHISSKIRRISRGALGNGLRVISGVILVTHAELIVSTLRRSLKLTPRFDGVTDYERLGSYDGKGTRIEMIFQPEIIEENFGYPDGSRYNADYWGKLAIDMAKGEVYKDDSSPHWFDSVALWNLLTLPSNKSRMISDLLKDFFGVSISGRMENLGLKNNNILICRAGEIKTEEQAADILEMLRAASPLKVNSRRIGLRRKT